MIYILNANPILASKELPDRLLLDQILNVAQIMILGNKELRGELGKLSWKCDWTIFLSQSGGHKSTHRRNMLEWWRTHVYYMLVDYTKRYGKKHGTEDYLNIVLPLAGVATDARDLEYSFSSVDWPDHTGFKPRERVHVGTQVVKNCRKFLQESCKRKVSWKHAEKVPSWWRHQTYTREFLQKKSGSLMGINETTHKIYEGQAVYLSEFGTIVPVHPVNSGAVVYRAGYYAGNNTILVEPKLLRVNA